MRKPNIKGIVLLAVLSLAVAAAVLPLSAPSVSVLYGDGSVKPDLGALAAAYSSIPGWVSSVAELMGTGAGAVALLGVATLFFLGAAASTKGVVFKHADREVSGGPYGKVAPYRGREAKRHLLRWNGRTPVEGGGVVVGCDGKNMLVVPCTHYLCFAPSNSGKSRRQVYLNIDYLTFSGTANIVVSDPSLELYSLTKKILQSRNYKVFLLDLENGYGERWSPTAELVSLARRGELEAASNRASELGAVLFPSVDKGENSWVYEGAASCFAAVALWVATSPEVPDDCRNLYTISDTINKLSREEGAAALKELLRSTEDPAIMVLASGFLAAGERQVSAILSTLLSGITAFCTPSMAYMTSASDIDLDEMTDPESRIAVFIKTLPKGSPTMRIGSAFMEAHLRAVVRAGKRRGHCREQWVIGDEWAGMPHYNLLFAFLQGRKYGLHHALWYQDSTENSMGFERDSLLANADALCLYKAGGIDDARLFSDYSGVRTVAMRTEGSSGCGASVNRSESMVESKQPVWEAGDLLHSNPYRDGVYLVSTITSHPECSGLFEGIPVVDVTKSPMSANFPTFGTREHEAEVITGVVDGLESAAMAQDRSAPHWTYEAEKKEEAAASGTEELFLG